MIPPEAANYLAILAKQHLQHPKHPLSGDRIREVLSEILVDLRSDGANALDEWLAEIDLDEHFGGSQSENHGQFVEKIEKLNDFEGLNGARHHVEREIRVEKSAQKFCENYDFNGAGHHIERKNKGGKFFEKRIENKGLCGARHHIVRGDRDEKSVEKSREKRVLSDGGHCVEGQKIKDESVTKYPEIERLNGARHPIWREIDDEELVEKNTENERLNGARHYVGRENREDKFIEKSRNNKGLNGARHCVEGEIEGEKSGEKQVLHGATHRDEEATGSEKNVGEFRENSARGGGGHYAVSQIRNGGFVENMSENAALYSSRHHVEGQNEADESLEKTRENAGSNGARHHVEGEKADRGFVEKSNEISGLNGARHCVGRENRDEKIAGKSSEINGLNGVGLQNKDEKSARKPRENAGLNGARHHIEGENKSEEYVEKCNEISVLNGARHCVGRENRDEKIAEKTRKNWVKNGARHHIEREIDGGKDIEKSSEISGLNGARHYVEEVWAPEGVVEVLGAGVRRTNGIYLTPGALARGMAGWAGGGVGDVVMDLSAGVGTLLVAAVRRAPHLRAIGVEKNPVLAIAAAINLVGTRLAFGQDLALGQDLAPGRGAGDLGDRIYIGDGLSAEGPWVKWEGRACAVLGNPPYLREKGNRELFAALKVRHPHLAGYFCARMDLQYLFFHRSADFLRPGAPLIFLTSAYWLSATHARGLRADMAARLRPELLVRVRAAGVFSDAPGHHTLVSILRRKSGATTELSGEFGVENPGEEPGRVRNFRAVSWAEAPRDWVWALDPKTYDGGGINFPEGVEVFEHPVWDLHDSAVSNRKLGDNWSFFVDRRAIEQKNWLQIHGASLGELLSDRQGFVSGADRFSRRHRRLYTMPGTVERAPKAVLGRGDEQGVGSERGVQNSAVIPVLGSPIFLFKSADELPDGVRKFGAEFVRPMIRASQIRANAVYFEAPGEEVALYIDRPFDLAIESERRAAGVILEHLQPFRPILERRREVQNGGMPWYRLHWPRERKEQLGVKLVSPRRAAEPCFALDLSGSVVSSDCTYLLDVNLRNVNLRDANLSEASKSEDSTDARPGLSVLQLIYLMVVLNRPRVGDYLRRFGKSKGAMLEFYSEPLRALPLPICRGEDGRLKWAGADVRGVVGEPASLEAERRACRAIFFEVLQSLPPTMVNTSLPGGDLLQAVGDVLD